MCCSVAHKIDCDLRRFASSLPSNSAAAPARAHNVTHLHSLFSRIYDIVRTYKFTRARLNAQTWTSDIADKKGIRATVVSEKRERVDKSKSWYYMRILWRLGVVQGGNMWFWDLFKVVYCLGKLDEWVCAETHGYISPFFIPFVKARDLMHKIDSQNVHTMIYTIS